MEKIIAVVVMIAIVIGLIATAVLPYVTSMNDAASEGQNQLNQFTGSIQGDSMTGAAMKAEIKSYAAKFSATNEPLVKVTVVGDSTSATNSTAIQAGDIATLNTKLASMPDGASYQKKTTASYPSGKAKEITYTLVALG